MRRVSVRNPLAEIAITLACVSVGLIFGPWWGLGILAALDVVAELRD